jgi:hypothetical protein
VEELDERWLGAVGGRRVAASVDRCGGARPCFGAAEFGARQSCWFGAAICGLRRCEDAGSAGGRGLLVRRRAPRRRVCR